jgi:hypothetical protein
MLERNFSEFQSKPNFEKIIDENLMTFEEYASLVQDPEFVEPRRFQAKAKNGAEILYLGAEHTGNPEDPQIAHFQQEFYEYDPDVVIVEGLQNGIPAIKNLIQDPDFTEKYKDYLNADFFVRQYGEPGLGLLLAIQNDRDFQSPEPSSFEQINFLLKHFSKEEVFVSTFYRSLDTAILKNDYAQSEDHKRANIDKEINTILENFQKETNWKDFDYSLEKLGQITKQIKNDDNFWDIYTRNPDRIDPTPWTQNLPKHTIINKLSCKKLQRCIYFWWVEVFN